MIQKGAQTEMYKASVALALILSVAIASSGWAMRCHGRIVSPGDTTYEVLAKCGPPTHIETHEESRLQISTGHLYIYDPLEKYSRPWVVEQVIIEEWTYNFGPHSFLYHLRFENGILDDISTGPYGF